MWWLKMFLLFVGTSLCLLVLVMALPGIDVASSTDAAAVLVIAFVLLGAGNYLPLDFGEEEK